MKYAGDLILQVQAAQDDHDEEVAALTRRLRALLLDLDVDSVGAPAQSMAPDGAKGAGAVIGWLAVQFTSAGTLGPVIAAVVGWASRTGHDVEVSYGEDKLKVSRVSSAQQQAIIDDFLARHAARS